MTALDRSISDIVLIVDDVPENLALLHDALDDAGHTVLVATDGETALQRARQSLPDVILLDAVMPGLDGFEVARRLKADFTTRHIPIVFMTGLTETEHVVAAFAAGGADYVTKPIRPAEVLARIAAHVQNARQIRGVDVVARVGHGVAGIGGSIVHRHGSIPEPDGRPDRVELVDGGREHEHGLRHYSCISRMAYWMRERVTC